jgi:hypothetical protein
MCTRPRPSHAPTRPRVGRYKVPRIAFVNKLDRQGANPFEVTRDLRTKLRLNAVMAQVRASRLAGVPTTRPAAHSSGRAGGPAERRTLSVGGGVGGTRRGDCGRRNDVTRGHAVRGVGAQPFDVFAECAGIRTWGGGGGVVAGLGAAGGGGGGGGGGRAPPPPPPPPPARGHRCITHPPPLPPAAPAPRPLPLPWADPPPATPTCARSAHRCQRVPALPAAPAWPACRRPSRAPRAAAA